VIAINAAARHIERIRQFERGNAMRWIAALLLFGLCACGQQPSSTPAAGQGGGDVTLGATKNLPDWLLVARTADRGYVHFNQRSIHRNADGTADIWVEIRHGTTQLREAEDALTRTAVRYDVERLHYRFRCAEDRFVILARQFMSGRDEVGAEEKMNPELWRPVPGRGIARQVSPIACRGR
jgi:hypothetical protein